MSKLELQNISDVIDVKIERIKFLDDTNIFENEEILQLKVDIRESIEYLKTFIQPKLTLIRGGNG